MARASGPPAFRRSLPMALLRAREGVMRPFRAMLRDFGLTEQQWRVLRALATAERFEAAALAQATVLQGPSLSRILRDLDARGLVDRRADEADLRRANVSLSARGRALMEAVAPRSEAIYADIAAAFGVERLEALHAMLVELEAAMRPGPET